MLLSLHKPYILPFAYFSYFYKFDILYEQISALPNSLFKHKGMKYPSANCYLRMNTSVIIICNNINKIHKALCKDCNSALRKCLIFNCIKKNFYWCIFFMVQCLHYNKRLLRIILKLFFPSIE